MRVGFTGTREGMTKGQHSAVNRLLHETLHPYEVHHGDCIGADAQFHLLAQKLLAIDGLEPYIVGHPPARGTLRARCRNFDELREPKDYHARNRDIVSETDVLIACPKLDVEEMRSGTWATVRYARKVGRKIYLVLPDGTVREEG